MRIRFLVNVWLCVLACLSAPLLAQDISLSGRVTDASNGEPLSFVNIRANGRFMGGTNIEGNYRLAGLRQTDTLHFSFVGYRSFVLPVAFVATLGTFDIQLEPFPFMLGEITIGEDPADRIMRRVIRNREQNNPLNISSFTYECYNKVTANPLFNSENAYSEMRKTFAGRHMMLLESYTGVKYKSPGVFQETVVSNRVSGLQDPKFTALATSFQPFTFYQESFSVLERDYITPVSEGALKRYSFTLEDTLFVGQDTVFVLTFQPREGRNFDALKGVLYINSNGYALQNVVAEPVETGNIKIKIEQRYAFVQGHWFPEELLFDIRLPKYPSKDLGMVLSGRSFLVNPVLNAGLEGTNFGQMALVLESSANNVPDSVWARLRTVPLGRGDKSTYAFYDSTSAASMLRFVEKIFNSAVTGSFEFGPLALDMGSVFRVNGFEGVRLGVGLYTSERLSRFFSAGGYVAYGLTDLNWKYGGSLRVWPAQALDMELFASYRNDVREPGQFRPQQPGFTARRAVRDALVDRMDFIEELKAGISFRPFRGLQAGFAFSGQHLRPAYPYGYQPEGNTLQLSEFRVSVAEASFRYVYRERLLQTGRRAIPLENITAPVFSFSYQQGLDGVAEGQHGFRRYTAVSVDAGLAEGNVPYPFLFNGAGSQAARVSWAYVPGAFQTMGLYEFANNRFANIYLKHHFGRLLFRLGRFQPEPVLAHASGFGLLDHPARHDGGLELQDMRKGFHESGIHLENLVRLNYVNLLRLGFGAGLYMRYGPYASDTFGDNLALKLIVSLSL